MLLGNQINWVQGERHGYFNQKLTCPKKKGKKKVWKKPEKSNTTCIVLFTTEDYARPPKNPQWTGKRGKKGTMDWKGKGLPKRPLQSAEED